MKRLFYLTLLLGFFFSCNKGSEPVPTKDNSNQSKPIKIEAITPESHGAEGIKLMGRVLFLNDDDVVEHGFLLRESETYNSASPIILKINKKIQTGTNELLYGQLPRVGVQYDLKYYVKTKSQEIQSEVIKFQYIPISLEPFAEKNVSQGEELEIRGDFSKIDSSYYIWSTVDNGTSADPIPYRISTDKKTLSFVISDRFNHGDEVSFSLSKLYSMPIYLGRVNVVAVLLPLGNFTVKYRDMLTFSAVGYQYDTKKPFSIIVGTNSFSLKTHTQAYVTDLVKGQNKSSFKFGYFNGIDTIYFAKPLTLSPPDGNDFFLRESVMHPNSSLRLSVYGLNEKMPIESTKTTLGNYHAYINPTWNGEDWMSVEDVPNGTYGLKFVNDYFSYVPKEKITVRKLEVKNMYPSIIRSEPVVNITGNFIDGKTYRLYSNIGMSSSEPAVNGTIKVRLEDHLADRVHIKKVGYYDDILIKETLVDVNFTTEFAPIQYSHFSPLKGNYDTKITVYGEGIGRGMIFFDGKWMPAFENNYNSASFYPYSSTLPGKYKIAVFHNNKWLTVDQIYEYNN